ncbi:beta strand repeat-containing protein [Flavobacterium sharifuzzamanii]|uniref:beta strand repeat-containing protein n=1 Tax=Flavobacterium sharifuzzamanii TaxID=2211133 RepID=UPI000DADADE7|nr:hypothetical protein [Flavobacterium sharifuzzamanii]KAF2082122.1 hypothetical protein DMA14_06525 [Flavobacterium sharifuzzamanii]
MATDRTNIGYKFEDGDIPSQADFQEVFNSFIHKDEDKADFQMVEEGRDNLHYVTPALLYTGLKNIGIITGNNYMPRKEHFDSFIGDTITLQYAPINYSVKVFKNGQLLLEKEGQGNDGDYIINYEMAKITFSGNIDNRNIEVDYWYKNLSPNSNPGGGSGQQIDFTSFLHTSGNETKNGILTFNNTTPTSTSGIVLTNSGADTAAKVLDVTVSGAGSGIAIQNTATGTGIKVSNTGSGAGLQVNSSATATGDPLQVLKDNVINAKIDTEGKVTAKNFITSGGLDTDFVKGDGSLDDTVYAEDTKVIHTSGNETKDGALKLTHNDSVEDVLTIIKSNSANCLKLVQNSTSNATTSTIDTNAENVNRKAISIQKKQVEKAFITHDGNVSGTSFTTLNEKADITDGFLTLAASDSATAMAGHAKLYAKTNGTTDLYVMGSDGVEKKIGENSLEGVLLTTTDQSFTGIKSVTNTGNTQTNGLVITNNGGGGSNSVSLTNNGDGIGLMSNNTSTGFGIYSRQTGEGGRGIYAGNSTDYGYGLFSHNTGNGTGIFAHTEFGSGNAISAITSGDGIGILSTTSYDGICIAANAASGATGLLYVGKNNGVNTFTVDKTGNVQANSFVKSGGTSSQYLMADGSVTTSAGASPEPSQITITTTTNITTDTLDANGKKQIGKNVIINNGTSAINITVNGGIDFNASYLKHGTGAITFIQATGRTLVQVNTTSTLNGAAGSTATISSIGTTDYLRISNV